LNRFVTIGLIVGFVTRAAHAQDASSEPPAATPTPASADKKAPAPAGDGWPDLSEFLDKKYGFLPVVMPITEPAVGYGAAGGLLFISKTLGLAAQGLGRPNITFAGGMATANGSWGVMGADIRYWLDDHIQTIAGAIHASVNLDYHGIGHDSQLDEHPLRYTLEPTAVAAIGKYRFGESRFWAGLGYVFSTTKVSFEAPANTPELPSYERTSNIGALLPSLVYDTRNNVFTPLKGVYVEANVALSTKWLGGDATFERVGLQAIQYLTLPHDFYFGIRTSLAASFGDAPFYVRPSIGLRGVPKMRYQGQEVAELEAELRWQFWKRWSLVGFAGAGDTWNDFEKGNAAQGVVAGGGGFRYELARSYGLHMGADLAFSHDTTAFYIQVGSAWMRP